MHIFYLIFTENIDVPVKTSLNKDFTAEYDDPNSDQYKALEKQFIDKVRPFCGTKYWRARFGWLKSRLKRDAPLKNMFPKS